MIEMELIGVRIEAPANVPCVLLRERTGAQRILPIFIGPAEAQAIVLALDGVVTPRPMTHDLIVLLLADQQVELERVVVTELQEKTFFAELHLRRSGVASVVSCRPSDAIAVAARLGTSIFAAATVVEAAGVQPPAPDTEAEEVVEEFREFIENINPEDFL
jgi:bifunctional DNase/RNase